MSKKIRTQISLNKMEYDIAKEQAKSLGISLAEFFRRSLRKSLHIDSDKPWMKYAGIISSGDSNSSQSIDDIVYG